MRDAGSKAVPELSRSAFKWLLRAWRASRSAEAFTLIARSLEQGFLVLTPEEQGRLLNSVSGDAGRRRIVEGLISCGKNEPGSGLNRGVPTP